MVIAIATSTTGGPQMDNGLLKRRRDDLPPPAGDHRTVYERDFARIIHSAAFRRLQSKTQVLGLGDSDFYRTRLTHSLEVCQIGEALAKLLVREAEKARDEFAVSILPDPTSIRAICLAHDIGHPPFGHGGEVALNRCMLDWGGFEGNGQTLRILTSLEPYHERFGMNLTRRTLLGVLKYPASYSSVVDQAAYSPRGGDMRHPNGVEDRRDSVFVAKPYKPPKCFLDTEIDAVNWMFSGDLEDDYPQFSNGRTQKKPNEHAKPVHMALDTSIMELADDISYGVHDLEDGIACGFITREDFEHYIGNELLYPLFKIFDKLEYGTLINDLFSGSTYSRKAMIGKLVHFCVCDARLRDKEMFVHPLLRYDAVIPPEVRSVLDKLQELVVDKVIKNANVQSLEFKGQKIVTELFYAIATDPRRLLLPKTWKKIEIGPQTDEHRMRVICDYISGMTDEYAIRRYQQLFAPRAGSIFDRM